MKLDGCLIITFHTGSSFVVLEDGRCASVAQTPGPRGTSAQHLGRRLQPAVVIVPGPVIAALDAPGAENVVRHRLERTGRRGSAPRQGRVAGFVDRRGTGVQILAGSAVQHVLQILFHVPFGHLCRVLIDL